MLMILENLLKLLKFCNLKCDSCEYRNKWICDAFESRSLFLSSPRWRATDESDDGGARTVDSSNRESCNDENLSSLL